MQSETDAKFRHLGLGYLVYFQPPNLGHTDLLAVRPSNL